MARFFYLTDLYSPCIQYVPEPGAACRNGQAGGGAVPGGTVLLRWHCGVPGGRQLGGVLLPGDEPEAAGGAPHHRGRDGSRPRTPDAQDCQG